MDDKLHSLHVGERIGGARSHQGRWRFPLILLVLLGVIGAGYLFVRSSMFGLQGGGLPPGEGDSISLAAIGIDSLPRTALSVRAISAGIERLQRERCDQAAVAPFGDVLKDAGYPRQRAEMLGAFYFRCHGPLEFLDDASEALLGLSDFEKARQYADVLVQSDPASARYRYLRGTAEEKLGRNQESLVDLINALNLLGDPAYVAGSEFYGVAQAYARLGRYCEAITPIQQWVSYDVARDNPQTQTIIREYMDSGHCQERYAIASETLSLPITSNVIVTRVGVNGVAGNFIIDTGASFVALTERFARQAGVSWDAADEIEMSTANGSTTGSLSRAEAVSLGAIEAHNVAAVVSKQDDFGEGVDGLLGMSFLARFEVSLTSSRFEITKAR